LTVDSIQVNDCATFRVMVSIAALLFILARTPTDVLHGLVDPRVRLG